MSYLFDSYKLSCTIAISYWIKIIILEIKKNYVTIKILVQKIVLQD